MTEKLEKEFAHFITFGNLLDLRSRRYLVTYFRDKITGAHPSESTPLPAAAKDLNEAYFRYLRLALDRILAVSDLLPLMQGNDRITEQVVLDTLYWMRKTFTKTATEHPYTEELELLQGWAVTPLRDFQRRYPFLLRRLQNTYRRTELDPGFYADRLKAFIDRDPNSWSEEERRQFDLLFTDLLSQWDALLQAKILAHQLQQLEQEEAQFTELLEAKVHEYRRLFEVLAPVTDYLGWDLSRELWQNSSLDILRHYDELLSDESSLQTLADMLGQMREAEIELEEAHYEKTIVRREWVVDPTTKAEIVGVHESRDLNRLVSSEAALLSEPSTEDLFLKKYADEQLLTFRYEDRRLVSSPDNEMEVHQRIHQKEKGPFIVCVDTSESMSGRPELIAKVLCLGLLKMAIRENRRAYLINFSVGIKTIDLLDVANSLEEIARFLRMSFYGGTDASLALYEALRQLKSNAYEDADVLMISDFVMYKIDQDVLAEIAFFQQNKNTEFHSLALSKEANAEILQRFDTNWIYDPNQKGIIRELTRGMGEIRARL